MKTKRMTGLVLTPTQEARVRANMEPVALALYQAICRGTTVNQTGLFLTQLVKAQKKLVLSAKNRKIK